MNLSDQEFYDTFGMSEDVLIWHLHHCFIYNNWTYAETNKYFQHKLGLDKWSVYPKDLVTKDLFGVRVEGVTLELSYYVSCLDSLKRFACIKGVNYDQEQND